MKVLFVFAAYCLLEYSSARLSLIHQRKSFFEAEVYCELHGGHLVSINSTAGNEAVHKLCDYAGSDCWIGLTQGDKGFQWTDGTAYSYNNWHPGEPNNWNGVEKCAKMLSKYHDGTWSDQSCDAQYSLSYFVCEFHEATGGQTSATGGNTGPTNGNTSPATTTIATAISTTEGHVVPTAGMAKLQVDSDHAHFTWNGTRVFLSGINQAWVAYAYDFGASQYQYRRQQYEKTIQQMAQSGGNSIRIWVHVEGETSPLFSSAGYVTGTDKDDTLVSDLRQYIRYAAQHNILVFITLWNAAVKQSFHYRIDGLIKDTHKLQSYLDHALTPMVKGLKDEPGLGGWDIINEIEGQLRTDSVSSDPCFDTRFLKGSGAGWAGQLYTAQEYLRFINYHVNAIRMADPLAQVTAGAWSPDSVTDKMNWRNLYKDECLVKAGGKQMGTLTFYSMHSYDWNQHYAPGQPFLHSFADYGLDKPLVVAEFNQKRGGGMTMSEQFGWLYHHGYAGGWAWSYTDENWSTQATGLASIRNYNNGTEGGLVAFHV